MGLDAFDGLKMGLDLLWSLLTASPLLTIGILVLIVSSLLVEWISNILRDRKLKKSGILQVDKMSGREFEQYLHIMLKDKYDVRLTPATGDFGADLILKAKDKKIIVQAKRYKKN